MNCDDNMIIIQLLLCAGLSLFIGFVGYVIFMVFISKGKINAAIWTILITVIGVYFNLFLFMWWSLP